MELRLLARGVLLVVALSGGCAADGGEGTTAAGLLHEAPEGAIAACREAQVAISSAAPEERYALLARGCADLFSLPLCREAVRLSPQARPELRSPMVAVACQRAYCPMLAEPPPGLCSLEAASADTDDLRAAWRPFVAAVLALELGLEPSDPLASLLTLTLDLLAAGPVTVAASTVPPPPRAEVDGPRAILRVQVATDGAGYRISAAIEGGERFGPHSLPLPPDAGDFAGLLEAAFRGAEGGRAIIEASVEVAYAVVVALMDALRQGGFEEIAIAVAAADQPAE